MILLNTDEHRQWEAAVATWPTCQTCGGSGCTTDIPACSSQGGCCTDCVAGRVPQPVYIVIEGKYRALVGPEYVVPARWRVPAGEPVELWTTLGVETGWASVLLATGTVEIRSFPIRNLTDPGSGRHFVAVITP